MPSDSDSSPIKNRKRKARPMVVPSSSDEDSNIPVRQRRTRARVSSSSDDSDGSVTVVRRHKKLRALSESESNSSSNSSSSSEEDDIQCYVSKNRKSNKTALQTDSERSDNDYAADKEKSNGKTESVSQTSDEESEKCIICFKAFRGIIAHPSGCSHSFHAECLLQWSKTSNTCPIDRVKYTQIIVTGTEGNIITKHEVSSPTPDADLLNDIEPDDPTFCEVCSQHDRENEMLLCDRCEAGYHMDCLTPPLLEVPHGDWFCPNCAANDNAAEIDGDEINELLRGATVLENRLRSRPPIASRRIGPRTRAAQRILSTIRRMAEESERYQPSSSTSSRFTNRRRRKKSRRRSARYEVNLVTVEGTTIEVKVAVNTVRRQKKKKKKSNASSSGRGRVCSSKRNSSSAGLATDGQLSGNHNNLRQPLDIFGSRPQLEYFSGWEAEDELDEEGGLAVLRPRNVGVRGMANRKQMAAQILRSAPRRPTPRINVSSAPPDLLSSILDEQAKWHSPNAVIQSNSNGEVKVILPNKETELPVKKTVGSGEASTSNEGKSSSSSSSSSSHKESGGGHRNGEASSSVPPLQPPPQPNFSRVYEDEDFDLYADIEPPLAPPPEPPALLLALDGDEGASSPEDAMLVIDDRQTYDPDIPTSPPPSPSQEQSMANKSEKEPNKKVADDKGTDVPPVDLSTIRLPSPEPDIDDCPNRVMYSEASVNIARQTKSDSESDKEIDIDDPINLMNRLSIAPTSNSGPKFSGNNVDANITVEERKDEMLFGEKCEDNIVENTKDKDDDASEEKAAENNTEEITGKYDPEVPDEKPKEESTKRKENEIRESQIKEDVKSDDDNCDSKDIKMDSNIQDVSQVIAPKDEDMESKEKEDSKLEEGEIKVDDDDDEEEEKKQQLRIKERYEENNDRKHKLMEVEDGISKCTISDESTVIDKEEEKKKFKEKFPEINDFDDKHKEHDWSPDSTPPRKTTSEKELDQEGEDVLELGCGDDERDGLVDITDEEISTYEKSWELEDNQASTEKTAGLEGLETEAISDCEYNIAEDGQVAPRAPAENGPKEEGEIISDEKKVPVAWKKITKAKERSYREKDTTKDRSKKKEKKPKEKRKELERYDVRKIISDKPKKRKVDEFGRDISPSRSHSLSDSRSRSRSRSVRSIRRSRSRSRSRSRKRRSRDRRSRNRSRGKRSRDRSKRRGGKSRSRSESRRRSRSSRKKERRSRGKSRDRKRRKRDSSISCSSCSCSSCERDRRKNKKLTVIVPNKKLINSGKEKKKNKYKERGDLKRRRAANSPVPSKEVFTSGDNILVSVNFKSSKSGEVGRKEQSKKKKDDESKKKKDKSSKENQPLRSIVSKSSNQLSQKRNRINAKNLKPVAIIDLAQSPFREQTLSPKEIIVLTDSDSDDKRKNDENSMPPCQMTGPKTPPEPHIKFNIISSKPQMVRSLANPLLDSVDQMEVEGEEEDDDERVEVPHKGPNTPPEPPVPYDPFEPTKSRSPTPLQEMEESRNPPTPPGDKITPPEPPQRPASPPPKPPPETPKTPSPLHSSPPKPIEDNPPEKLPLSPPNNCNDDSMDMGGGDSPYSPGSSDGEDIFEPPLMSTPAPLPKIKSRPAPKHLQKLTPSPLKRKPGNKTLTPLKNSKGSKKDMIGLKLDEDQLKILDDLPSSAVEMQVKDKFLKKLNRQERVVEEVKMVLKPHYAKKHVTKEEYKEILRKSVPKICHSRSGEINPMKIQRLIEAYVKKYRHLRKKRKMATFGALDSNPLLKPKPKQTMWC